MAAKNEKSNRNMKKKQTIAGADTKVGNAQEHCFVQRSCSAPQLQPCHAMQPAKGSVWQHHYAIPDSCYRLLPFCTPAQ